MKLNYNELKALTEIQLALLVSNNELHQLNILENIDVQIRLKKAYKKLKKLLEPHD